jgi:hypothetical protein
VNQAESFYFGSGGQLFGMYHPASGYSCNHGIVICPPLFHEYYRSHFTIKRIAMELASRGYDVLRFDYSGTGDSKGNIPSDIFSVWSTDIGEAMAEIRALTGQTQVSLVATRYSASLGLPSQAEFTKFVCWDPILDHCDYAQQVDAINKMSLDEHLLFSKEERAMQVEDDYLGIGLSRTSFAQALSGFAERLDAQGLRDLPQRSVNIHSDVNWVSAGLQMIYAHEIIRQVADAM